jgi:quinol monooxygenase YgiN
MTGMIHVIATIDLGKGKRDAFLNEVHLLVPKVRAEVGCIEYGPTVDLKTGIAAQLAVRDDVVTIVEKWSGLPALEDHLRAPHMAEYRSRVKEMVLGVKLQVLEPV